jgi:cyclophilin family peptidyl-prolyl cis-trans isomerase
MSRVRLSALACTGAALLAAPFSAFATDVAMCTDLGRIVIRIDDDRTPIHAANFLRYVDSGHYMGSVFHRVIGDFMIQGGGFDRRLRQLASESGVENESRNGSSNRRGTIAAARTSDPHSAAAQFFINLVDNAELDASARDWGYTVFGEVTEGMDIVDRIGALPTHGAGPFPGDVPDPLIAIESVARILQDPDANPDEWPALVRSRLDDALVAGDHEAAMTWFEQYRATCIPVDSAFMVDEAESASASGRNAYARSVLNEYFATATATDADFERATALFSALAPGETPPATGIVASCAAPVPPDIPDGTRENLDGMLAAQAAVRTFMQESNTYLECLDEIIDDKNMNATARQSAVDAYNASVDVTQTLGEEFNAQVRAFKARESARGR